MSALLIGLWFSLTIRAQEFETFLYSPYGEEMQVSFQARYLTPFKTIEEMNATLPSDRSYYLSYTIEPTLKYLFGPLTHRGWGGIKKHLKIEVDWNHATVRPNGVELPYVYEGVWLLDTTYFDLDLPPIPVPYNTAVVLSDRWKKCTDNHHDSESFYWYYWVPDRPGCDHAEGLQYQNVSLKLSNTTSETINTFPEYQKMIKMRDGQPTFSMTFAFGYFEEPTEPNPDTDIDVGAREYQRFVKEIRRLLPSTPKKESPIMRESYPDFDGRNFAIGHRFLFPLNGVNFDVKVVINGRIDQMILFARSYAFEHDSYFGWMGHSRVGSGFDALRFANMLQEQPTIYSITPEYQVIYWGGCNSYSYYTEPFFQLKAANNINDPNGTKGLDIIANGLPSYFGLNADNALIHYRAFIQWNRPQSYQDLLYQMETAAGRFGTHVLAVVLGDEDNH